MVALNREANLDMHEAPLSGIHGDLSKSSIDFHEQIGSASEKPLILSGLIVNNKGLSCEKPLMMSGFRLTQRKGTGSQIGIVSQFALRHGPAPNENWLRFAFSG
jgi:hypothetical protein